MFSLFDSVEIFVFERTNGKTPPRKNADIEFSHHDIDLLISSADLREICLFNLRQKILVTFDSSRILVVICDTACGFYEVLHFFGIKHRISSTSPRLVEKVRNHCQLK